MTDITIILNDMTVVIEFPQRPSDTTLAALKGQGFEWDPRERCWVAAYDLTTAGTADARQRAQRTANWLASTLRNTPGWTGQVLISLDTPPVDEQHNALNGAGIIYGPNPQFRGTNNTPDEPMFDVRGAYRVGAWPAECLS